MTVRLPCPPAPREARSRACRWLPCALFSENGFTLVELLVVMVVIGILAAIAYAAFLGQKTKANDAAAKDTAAALTVDVESCFTNDGDYTLCDSAAEINDPALPYDGSVTAGSDCSADPASAFSGKPDNSKVAVLAAQKDCYVLAARSRDGGLFWVVGSAGNAAERGCVPPGQGGCVATSDPTVGTWNRD